MFLYRNSHCLAPSSVSLSILASADARSLGRGVPLFVMFLSIMGPNYGILSFELQSGPLRHGTCKGRRFGTT